ncbi:MAG: MYXO-CTERM sorting domain-containing protein [Polyangiaceae bacterium]
MPQPPTPARRTAAHTSTAARRPQRWRTDGGSPPVDDDGILEGGGISCNIGSTEGGSAGWGAFAALALTGFVRRRRNRETGR